MKTRAASRGARASPAADVSFSIEHMQAARRARKSKPAAEQASRGRKLTPAQRLLGPKNKKAKTPASARAQPSTGGRARVGKKAKLDVVRAAGGYGASRSKARSAAGGSGGSGGGYGREQGPGEERDLRDMGILFRADFTEEQFVRLAMNPAGVRRSVDKIIDKQQLDRGYSRETLVKARSWFEEWVGGMDRLIMAVERADRMALEEPELPAPSADEQVGRRVGLGVTCACLLFSMWADTQGWWGSGWGPGLPCFWRRLHERAREPCVLPAPQQALRPDQDLQGPSRPPSCPGPSSAERLLPGGPEQGGCHL